jgi:hypothetical protein
LTKNINEVFEFAVVGKAREGGVFGVEIEVSGRGMAELRGRRKGSPICHQKESVANYICVNKFLCPNIKS